MQIPMENWVWQILALVGALAPLVLGNHTRSSDRSDRSGRANLVSFQALGEEVLLGLDLVVPFLTVPIGKQVDKYGGQRALVNIDTASLIVSGLVTGGGLAVGHLFRSLGLQTREGEDEVEDEAEGEMKTERAARQADPKFASMFEPFKLAYTDAEGERVDTTLGQLLGRLEEYFVERDVDLSACLQKSICSLVREADIQVRRGRASGAHKIIDGLVHLQWLEKMLRRTALRPAVDVGRGRSRGRGRATDDCDAEFEHCKWSAPQLKLLELFRAHVRFT